MLRDRTFSYYDDITMTSPTRLQVVQHVEERAVLHVHADGVDLWLHDDPQQRKDGVVAEHPAKPAQKQQQRIIPGGGEGEGGGGLP